MSSKKTFFRFYLKHSSVILLRYRQMYFYFIVIAAVILMPLFFHVKETYFGLLACLNIIIVLWLFNSFYLCQFSFSPDDARSLSLFPLKIKDLIIVRNILNFSILMVAFILSIALMGIFYPTAKTSLPEIIVLSAMHLLPAISIGNLTSGLSIFWKANVAMSWKSSYVILTAYFNVLVIKISQIVFSKPVAMGIVVTIFILYLVLYYLSFRKVQREITTYFSSIAEK